MSADQIRQPELEKYHRRDGVEGEEAPDAGDRALPGTGANKIGTGSQREAGA
ncbi:MAG: hypothetical protein R3F11_12840 [Verrucomicrobiales bacterium]